MTNAIEMVQSYGFNVTAWPDFVNATGYPVGLLNRAAKTKAECEGRGEVVTHVVWDPQSDADGFLLLGDDPEALAAELAETFDA